MYRTVWMIYEFKINWIQWKDGIELKDAGREHD